MIWALAALAAPAQTTLSVDEAGLLAAQLEAQGQRAEAAALVEALLARDPGDAAALIVLARLRRAAGDTPGALEAARQAWRGADRPDLQYAASTEAAAAQFLLERRLFAQFWLRRAAQVAPNEQLRAEAIRNFRNVNAQTPWRLTFNFGVLPSSNVNNGSSEDTIEILGLPFRLSGDARALSGLEITASGSARYRFAGLNGRAAELYLGTAVQRVRLSDEAKRQAPNAEAADYAYEVFELGLSQVLTATGRGRLRLDTLAGRNRYGGEALSNYARAGLTWDWPTGENSVSSANLSVERQVRFDNADRSAWIGRVGLSRTWRLGSGDLVSVSGNLRRTRSDAPDIDHRAAEIGLNYRRAEPFLGRFGLSGGMTLERRLYDENPFSADGRQDTRARATATVEFPSLDYYGFAPALTFEASRTASNITLYSTTDLGVRLGLQSVF
jgi:hypothetical protein